MPSFGEKLKKEREKRAITLEQVSLSTKIGTRMLQALEQDNFSQLPGGIFNRGFVRAYARHVGLDEEQTVADYLVASGEANAPPASAVELQVIAEQTELRQVQRKSQPLPWGVFAAILLALAVGLFWWSRRERKPDVHPSAQPTTAQQEITPPAANPASGAAPTSARPQATQPTATSAPAAKPQTVPAPKPPVVSPPESNTSGTAKPTVAEASPTPGEFVLVVRAAEDCWISVTVDGQPASIETLSQGNQRVIHARNQVVVKAGNIGALDFVFNGKRLGSQGESGVVKTLTFGSEGLQPNVTKPPVVQ